MIRVVRGCWVCRLGVWIIKKKKHKSRELCRAVASTHVHRSTWSLQQVYRRRIQYNNNYIIYSLVSRVQCASVGCTMYIIITYYVWTRASSGGRGEHETHIIRLYRPNDSRLTSVVHKYVCAHGVASCLPTRFRRAAAFGNQTPEDCDNDRRRFYDTTTVTVWFRPSNDCFRVSIFIVYPGF